MSDSDPMVFAARAAAMTDTQLCLEWKAARHVPEGRTWLQALRDEIAARHRR